MSILSRFCLVACAAVVSLALPALAEPNEDFPEPEGIQPAVDFWQRVYLDATTDGGFLHDSEHLNVIYEKLTFNGAEGRTRERAKETRRDHWERVLTRLAVNPEPRDDEEQQVLKQLEKALGREPRPGDLREAKQRIRFQLGQRDKFLAGLVRSGAYEDSMRDVFRRAGLPEDLAYLPHVESSFNIRAYSKYGAAGAWQFMRSTGRMYMHVDYVIDERLDPMVATASAARLLGENYEALQSWPFALTAYNHGRGGMLRAKKLHGDNIVNVIRSYESRSFGFASRNFYAQFLAARRIMRNHGEHFGQIERDQPEPIDEVTLPFYTNIRDIERYLGVSRDVVSKYNPALRPPVFTANKRIPKGYVLRLPAGTTPAEAQTWLASIPNEKRYSRQNESNYYKVKRGDTLSAIARRNGTSVNALVAANNLSRKHRIIPGEVLQIPARGGREPDPGFELVRTANANEDKANAEVPDVPKPRSELVKQRAEATQAKAAETKPVAAVEPEKTVAAVEPIAMTAPEAIPAVPSGAVAPAEPKIEKIAAEKPAVAVAETASAKPTPAAEPVVATQVTPALPRPVIPEGSPWRDVRGSTITVDSLETLGHYAEWLELPATRLRKLNGIKGNRGLRLGQRIKLDLSKVSAATFMQRRTEYHKAIEEDFFGSYEVVRLTEHRIKPGESIWELCNQTYDVPAWLVHRYNPELNLSRLTPGVKLVIPVVEALSAEKQP